VRQDVVEGLRYVLGHPILRNISLMMAVINLIGSTTGAQIVFFAKERLGAGDAEISLLYSAGSVGIIVLSLAAAPLRRRFRFGTVALGALALDGLLTIAFGLSSQFWEALVLWALLSGGGVLFNITTGSLRQTIVPNHLLGRVMSVAGVLAWSAIPLGTLAGGWLIERTGSVSGVYAGIGAATALVALAFAFSPLGRAERYITPIGPRQEARTDAPRAAVG
jgi:MFS family permease